MILLIDNYDSFTYNLYQYLTEMGAQVDVRRNDMVTVDEVRALSPEKILISPGPGTPSQAGICLDVIQQLGAELPILGVCLGHQCIGQVFGGKVIRAPELKHGKSSPVYHRGAGVMKGLPSPFEAGRYHSLVVSRDSIPDELEITAETADGIVMGLKHKRYPIEGVQFHPESVLTPMGKKLLGNFLAREV